jgi:hypothetical protein
MPNLPLDHPEPFAATVGVMLYPGEDEDSRRRALAFTAQSLAEPLRQFHEAGHSLAYQDLARIASDSGVRLDDIEKRWWEGSVTGEIFKTLLALARSDETLASWGHATELVELIAARHRVSGSRSSLYRARSRYRSVAHLWGAWSIREQRFQSHDRVGCDGWHDFQFFLAEAETLRRWGQSWRPLETQSEPLLPTAVWCVPEGWEPPESQPGWPPTGVIPRPTIPDDLLARLRRPGRPRNAR